MDYQKIYDQIIERAKSENRQKGGGVYYEKHHIVPSCLGGSNDKENLVLLTAREHFLCHWLLHEIYPNNTKLSIAFWMMCNVKDKNQDRYIPSSRIVGYALENFKNLRGPLHPCYGRKASEEEIQRKRDRFIGDKNPAKRLEVREKIRQSALGRKGPKHTEEFKKRLGEMRKGDKNPMAILAKKGLTKEHRDNISKSQIGIKRPHSKVECPHCKLVGGKANMVRYHFDNCKNKK